MTHYRVQTPGASEPLYDVVIRATSMREAADIGFDHAEEIGVPQSQLEVTRLQPPDDGKPGICYEANDWRVLRPQRRSPARRQP